MRPRNPPSPMPMPVDHSRCFEISSTRPLGVQKRKLRTNCFPWMAPPYLCGYRCFPGRSPHAPREGLSSISCSIMMGTCPQRKRGIPPSKYLWLREKNGKRALILGDAKTSISRREISLFQKIVKRAAHLDGITSDKICQVIVIRDVPPSVEE
jgi:hypothetical protein